MLSVIVISLFTSALCQYDEKPIIALVNYRPLTNPDLTPTEILEGNTRKYLKILEKVNSSLLGQELYFIAFPDNTLHYGINTTNLIDFAVADLVEGANPCQAGDYPKFLRDLSCGAKNFHAFIAANVIEKTKCGPFVSPIAYNCKVFDNTITSTFLVFDDTGSIRIRYEKSFTTAEKYFDNGALDRAMLPVFPKFQIVAKYGILVSGDALATFPPQTYLDKKLKSFLHLTSENLDLPFLSSSQIQQMFAYGHNVNLLTAAADIPEAAVLSTGIYLGSDGLISEDQTVEHEDSTAFIYKYSPIDRGENPKKPPLTTEEIDNLAQERDELEFEIDISVLDYNSTFLDTTKPVSNQELCFEDTICCQFSTEISIEPVSKNSYTYRFVSYFGYRNLTDAYKVRIQVCAIIACLDSSLASCGRRFHFDEVEYPVTFRKISVVADSVLVNYTDYFPNSLLSSLTTIEPTSTRWEVQKEENRTRAVYEASEAQNRLLTFGVYSINRVLFVYDNDYNHGLNDSESTTTTTATTPRPSSCDVPRLRIFLINLLIFVYFFI